LFKAREKELSKLGVTAMEAAVLNIVRAIGSEATPAEISRWLLREPHSVSGLLNRMVKRGLIKKTKDLKWKNLIRVTITDKGKEAYEKSLSAVSVDNVVSALSADECEKLSSYLMKLRSRALEEINVDYEVPLP
jgi:DNA-binding MarR family transcriptional regulator